MSNIIVDASIILQMFDEAEAGKKAWKFLIKYKKDILWLLHLLSFD